MVSFIITMYSHHDTQANHCHFLALVPNTEINWRLTKYVFLHISLFAKNPTHFPGSGHLPSCHWGTVEDGASWSAPDRAQSFSVTATLGYALAITRDLTLPKPWSVLSVSIAIQPPARSDAKPSTRILKKIRKTFLKPYTASSFSLYP